MAAQIRMIDGDGGCASTPPPVVRFKQPCARAPSVPHSQSATKQKPTVAHMLGEVTWLFSQSATHKHFALGDLEWMVMPPLMLEQYRVFRGDASPVGVAFWAYLSEDAEKKLESGSLGSGARLRPDEWKSGDRLWLVDMVGPFATPENKQTEAMLADLIKNVFGEKKFKFHRTDPTTGKRETVELGGRS